jgi:hypothetical protein
MQADFSPRGRSELWYIFAGLQMSVGVARFCGREGVGPLLLGHSSNVLYDSSLWDDYHWHVTLGIDGYVTSSRATP